MTSLTRIAPAFTALTIAVSATGCAEMLGVPTPGKKPAQQQAPAAAAATSTFTGTVWAPAGLSAERRVLSLEEAPLAGAEVFLADAAGQPLPGLRGTTTDDKGRFTLTDVPTGYTFVVAAKARSREGKDVQLQTLAKSGQLGGTVQVDTATTLITAAVVEEQGDLGNFNPARFRTAAEQVAANLRGEEPPDLSTRSAIRAKVTLLADRLTELKSLIELVREDLKDLKSSLADLKTELAKLPKVAPRLEPPKEPVAAVPPQKEAPAPLPAEGEKETGVKAGGAPAERQFVIFPGKFQSNAYPVVVEFRAKDGATVAARVRFEAEGDRPVASVPLDTPHDLWVKTSVGDGFMKYWGGFTIPAKGPDAVPMPFAAKENPPVAHGFTLKPGKFAAADYPVVVEFREKGGDKVVTRVQFEAETDAPVGKVPHGQGHDLWVSTRTHAPFRLFWGGFAIQPDVTGDVQLPFGP
jgi:hypothetical protein